MAIPDFAASAGLALMRQAPGGEWFFVSWINGAGHVSIELLGSGTHRYELWWVVGASQSDVITASYAGSSRIGTIEMKR